MTASRLLPEGAVRRFCEALFSSYGFTGDESSIITDVLVTADLFGIESHGIQRLIRYHEALRDGFIDPKAVPEKVFETPLSAVFDAHLAMGQLVGAMAMGLAVEKARAHGFGGVAVRRANHYGIAGYYTRMAAREGFIGVCMTNSEAIAVPTNGRTAMLGTNPIAFAMPARPAMFSFDAATTVVPRGKLEVYVKEDKPLPNGWAVDERGVPTTDAARVIRNIVDKAGGGILPFGGADEVTGSHKGYGFGMVAEIMTSVLAGGVTSNHVGHSGNGCTSMSFWAIDMGMFGDREEIIGRLSALTGELRKCGLAHGQERVWIHGEKELESAEEKRKTGLPANPKTIAEMRAIAREQGVDFDRYFD